MKVVKAAPMLFARSGRMPFNQKVTKFVPDREPTALGAPAGGKEDRSSGAVNVQDQSRLEAGCVGFCYRNDIKLRAKSLKIELGY